MTRLLFLVITLSCGIKQKTQFTENKAALNKNSNSDTSASQQKHNSASSNGSSTGPGESDGENEGASGISSGSTDSLPADGNDTPLPASGGRESAFPQKPNVIVILADDLSWDQWEGEDDFFETPNLLALAKKGMVYSRANAGFSTCVPSRASLLTGTYSTRHRRYYNRDLDAGDKSKQRLLPGKNQSLNPDLKTFGNILHEAGYVTGFAGKWHISKGSDAGRGFDEKKDLTNNKDSSSDPKMVNAITNFGLSFIEKNKEKNFLLYLAHHAPHLNYNARSKDISHFQEKKSKNKDKYKGYNPLYAAMIFYLDEGIGKILDKLKNTVVNGKTLEDNTLILFSSDNPQKLLESKRHFRGQKLSLYDGGVRVPFIAKWPGVIKENTRNDASISLVDIFNTISLLSGNKNIPETDGLDISGTFLQDDSKVKGRPIFWHMPGYAPNTSEYPFPIPGHNRSFTMVPLTVIRKNEYKLMIFHEEWQCDGGKDIVDESGKVKNKNADANAKALELYDTKNDTLETKNIINDKKEIRNELVEDTLAWMKKSGAEFASISGNKCNNK